MNRIRTRQKKFKFEYLAGPYQTHAEVRSVLSIIKASMPKDNIVCADQTDFGQHEMDATLKAARKNSLSHDKATRIHAKGYFICLKTESKQDEKFFKDQEDEFTVRACTGGVPLDPRKPKFFV